MDESHQMLLLDMDSASDSVDGISYARRSTKANRKKTSSQYTSKFTLSLVYYYSYPGFEIYIYISTNYWSLSRYTYLLRTFCRLSYKTVIVICRKLARV